MDHLRGPRFQVVCGSNGRINQTAICVKCGYDLHGLRPDGACPECGTAVGRSIQGDCLYFAPPEWIEKLARGMNWIVAGIIVSVFGGILAGLALGTHWAAASLLILGVVRVGGCWLLTTAEPARRQEQLTLNARTIVRFTVGFNYVAAWALWGPVPVPARLGAVGAVILGLTLLVECISTFAYARQLAIRIPSPKLADESRELMWGWIVVATLEVVLIIVGGPRGPSGPAIVVGCVAIVLTLAVLLLTLFFILSFRRKLSETASLARAIWVRPVPGSN